MPHTLYISDLDGTLLQNDATLSSFAKEKLTWLATHTNLCFSIATARTSASALRILQDIPFSCPIVLMNGVILYDTIRRREVNVEYLSHSAVESIIHSLHKNEVNGFLYQLQDQELITYYEQLDSPSMQLFVEERVQRYQKRFIQTSFTNIADENILYFTLLGSKHELDQVYQDICLLPEVNATFYKNTYEPDSWYLEIFSGNASKRHAIERLRRDYGFDRVVCFGDNLNDLPMFEISDVSCAVGNAQSEVKAHATKQIGPNTDDAVVRYLLSEASFSE